MAWIHLATLSQKGFGSTVQGADWTGMTVILHALSYLAVIAAFVFGLLSLGASTRLALLIAPRS